MLSPLSQAVYGVETYGVDVRRQIHGVRGAPVLVENLGPEDGQPLERVGCNHDPSHTGVDGVLVVPHAERVQQRRYVHLLEAADVLDAQKLRLLHDVQVLRLVGGVPDVVMVFDLEDGETAGGASLGARREGEIRVRHPVLVAHSSRSPVGRAASASPSTAGAQIA